MTTHDIKTHLSMWSALMLGAKTAEFRVNDRDYKQGDILNMRFVDDEGNTPDKQKVLRPFKVMHIVRGPSFGIPDGYCMMSIRPTHVKEPK